MGNENKKLTFSDGQRDRSFAEGVAEQSKSWTQDQWNRYLASFESPIAEKQTDVNHYDRIAARQTESIFSYSQRAASPELFAKIQNALFTLTAQQRAVIDLLYYKSKSHRETAYTLSISQSRVRDLRNQALKNLKSELQRGALTLPLVDKQKKEKENV